MVSFIDAILPDSASDFGAILFWVLVIVLVIISIIDIYTYLTYRNTSKKIEKPHQNLDTVEQIKKSNEDKLQELIEIRKKVDTIIEINKL